MICEGMQRVHDYIKQANLFYLATIDGDQARVRPFGFVMLFEERLYFTTTSEKKAYQQMLENPKVELCILGKDGGWLRLAGTVVFDDSPELRAAKKAASPHLDKLYEGGADNPILRNFYLKDCWARFCYRNRQQEEYRF